MSSTLELTDDGEIAIDDFVTWVEELSLSRTSSQEMQDDPVGEAVGEAEARSRSAGATAHGQDGEALMAEMVEQARQVAADRARRGDDRLASASDTTFARGFCARGKKQPSFMNNSWGYTHARMRT